MEWIRLAPSFIKEVFHVYESWESKDVMPMKLKELMMVLQLAESRRYRSK